MAAERHPIPGDLTARASSRRDALLPRLLDELRARGRRRRRRRATVAAVAAVLPLLAWGLTAARDGTRGAPSVPRVRDDARAVPFDVVETDPTVLARCTIVVPPDPRWALDDAGLQAELAALDRPAGLVRVGDRVLVSRDAVDPFPGDGGSP
jgi:hypothetical protein